jgi:hypothetical protein
MAVGSVWTAKEKAPIRSIICAILLSLEKSFTHSFRRQVSEFLNFIRIIFISLVYHDSNGKTCL